VEQRVQALGALGRPGGGDGRSTGWRRIPTCRWCCPTRRWCARTPARRARPRKWRADGAGAGALARRVQHQDCVLVDSPGIPLTFFLTSGTAGDDSQAIPPLGQQERKHEHLPCRLLRRVRDARPLDQIVAPSQERSGIGRRQHARADRRKQPQAGGRGGVRRLGGACLAAGRLACWQYHGRASMCWFAGLRVTVAPGRRGRLRSCSGHAAAPD
jgi:hypothetical protein